MLSTTRVVTDVGPDTYSDFPHTRALLAHMARQFRPPDSLDGDMEGDDLSKLPSAFVTKVVSLLDQEHEDELKILLKDKYSGIDDDIVRYKLTLCRFGLMLSKSLNISCWN
jgi:hypothetical protein